MSIYDKYAVYQPNTSLQAAGSHTHSVGTNNFPTKSIWALHSASVDVSGDFGKVLEMCTSIMASAETKAALSLLGVTYNTYSLDETVGSVIHVTLQKYVRAPENNPANDNDAVSEYLEARYAEELGLKFYRSADIEAILEAQYEQNQKMMQQVYQDTTQRVYQDTTQQSLQTHVQQLQQYMGVTQPPDPYSTTPLTGVVWPLLGSSKT